ncbi:MAG TPA: hypothetical protein VHD33_01115, partial [Legionellaceae bacterium]|nr:hypothetical protein [Legionellaceae bacterium]
EQSDRLILKDYIVLRLANNDMRWKDLGLLSLPRLLGKLKTIPGAMAIRFPMALLEVEPKNNALMPLLNYGFSSRNITELVVSKLFRAVCLRICENLTEFEDHLIHPLTKAYYLFQSSYGHYLRFYAANIHKTAEVYHILIQNKDLSTLIIDIHFTGIFYGINMPEEVLPTLFPQENPPLTTAAAKKKLIPLLVEKKLCADTVVGIFGQSIAVEVAGNIPPDSISAYLGSQGLDAQHTNIVWQNAITQWQTDAKNTLPNQFQLRYLAALLQTLQLQWQDICRVLQTSKTFVYLTQLEQMSATIPALWTMAATTDLFLLNDTQSIPLLVLRNAGFTIDELNQLQPFAKNLCIYYICHYGCEDRIRPILTNLCGSDYFSYLNDVFPTNTITDTITRVFDTICNVLKENQDLQTLPLSIHLGLHRFKMPYCSLKNISLAESTSNISDAQLDDVLRKFTSDILLHDMVQRFGEGCTRRIQNICITKNQISRQNHLKINHVFSALSGCITVKALLMLGNKELVTLSKLRYSYTAKNPITNCNHSVFQLKDTHLELLPLLMQNHRTLIGIHALDPNSLKFSIYANSCFCTRSPEEVSSIRFKQLEQFCNSPYYQFLNEEIFSPMHNEWQRLDHQQQTAPLPLNQQKAQLMEAYMREIKNIILRKANQGVEAGKALDEIVQTIHTDLRATFKTIVNDPVLKQQHYPMWMFFVKILGVIIAACGLFLPLLSKNYRQTFFADTVEIQQMKGLEEKMYLRAYAD